MDESILVVNCGSSSLKLALFDKHLQKTVSALAEKLNKPDTVARLSGDEQPIKLPDSADHRTALQALIETFTHRKLLTGAPAAIGHRVVHGDRKSTRLNSSHVRISYAVFCLKKKTYPRD